MRRRGWERALAGLLALWFGIVTADPAVLLGCTVHGGGHDGSHRAHPTTARHTHAAAKAHAPSDRHHAPVRAHACTCPGECCTAVAIATPASPTTIAIAVTVDHRAAPTSASDARPLAPRAHARPPSIGPPELTA
jgi:hypothetical protein